MVEVKLTKVETVCDCFLTFCDIFYAIEKCNLAVNHCHDKEKVVDSLQVAVDLGSL